MGHQKTPLKGQTAPARLASASLWLTLAVLIHPYSIVVVGLLLGLWTLHRHWGEWGSVLRKGLALAALTLPALPYLAWIGGLFLRHPVFSRWAAAMQNPSPAPVFYALGFAPALLLALAGLRRRTRTPALIWLLAGSLLLYVTPASSQRRMLAGLEVPLAILAAEGAVALYHALPLARAWRRRTLTLVLAALPLTMAFVLLGTTFTLATRPETAFTHRDAHALYTWLGDHATEADVVLAASTPSTRIPTYTAARVVWGNLEPETLDAEAKAAQVAAFYAANNAAVDHALLCEWGITVVVWGPEEQALGDYDPRADARVRPVERWGAWTLWTVEDNVCAKP